MSFLHKTSWQSSKELEDISNNWRLLMLGETFYKQPWCVSSVAATSDGNKVDCLFCVSSSPWSEVALDSDSQQSRVKVWCGRWCKYFPIYWVGTYCWSSQLLSQSKSKSNSIPKSNSKVQVKSPSQKSKSKVLVKSLNSKL